MSLADLIRKRGTVKLANANPANPANDGQAGQATLATLAALALANPAEEKAASYWWLIHYADRNPVEVACSPPTTHAEMLAAYPAALAAEPFEPIRRLPVRTGYR